MAEATTAVTTETETTTKVAKAKVEKTGSLILDIAKEVEGLSKAKALHMADALAENVEVSYFRLGGVLGVINENSWFEGAKTFAEFVYNKYGFQERKAKYLISIYHNLVDKQIPWEKIAPLGWTKMKDLAPILTPDNVDMWAEKAAKLTVAELQAAIKAGQPSAEGEKTAKTTDDVVKMSFKLKQDQSEIVLQALAKAKGELHTEFDTVALENICAGYVGGTSGITVVNDLETIVKELGIEEALQRIAVVFPDYDIEAGPHKETAQA